MPCSDVTEILEISLDANDRLSCYSLRKRTCGRAVGERDLLAEVLMGKSMDEILSLEPWEVAGEEISEEEAFLRLKHLFAVRHGLEALHGLRDSGPSSPIKAARIFVEGDQLGFEADLVVDILVEEIKSCGRCSGCGTKKPALGVTK